MSKYPVVRIEWIDAEADNTWRTAGELAGAGPLDPCVSIGYLVKTPTRKSPTYSVAATRSETGDAESLHFNAIQTIPSVWVRKVERLTYETSEFKKPRVPKSDGLRVDVGSGEGPPRKDQD